MASDSEPRNFLSLPEAPPEVTFRGIKMFFYCNFSTKKHLQIAKSIYKEVISSSQKL